MPDYGAQIFINGTSFDVINAFVPDYILDVVTSASGSKTYDIPPTTTITAKFVNIRPSSAGNQPTITISGNTVSWSSNVGTIFIYST